MQMTKEAQYITSNREVVTVYAIKHEGQRKHYSAFVEYVDGSRKLVAQAGSFRAAVNHARSEHDVSEWLS